MIKMDTHFKKKSLAPNILRVKSASLVLMTVVFLFSSAPQYARGSTPTDDLQEMSETETSSQGETPINLVLPPGVIEEFSVQQIRAWRWWWGWMGGLSLLGVGALSLALQESGNSPNSLATMEGYSMSLGLIGLGLVSTAIQRPKSMHALDELNAMPRRTPEERAQVKARALELKQEDRKQAQRGNSWIAHTLTVAVASMAGTFLWLRHDDPFLGLRSFASAVLVTELRMLMRPEFSSEPERAQHSTSTNILKFLTVFPYSLEEGQHQGFALGGRF